MEQFLEFFQQLFGVNDWPARWVCGRWTSFHGWLYIISDFAIFGAYFAIPALLAYFLTRKSQALPRIGWLFVAFIFLCGITHLIDGLAFWWPAYRLNGLARFFTAGVSWLTVLALVKVIPTAMEFRSPKELHKEIAERKHAEHLFKGLLDAAPDAMVIVDGQGKIKLINEQTENLFGFSREEIIGEKVEILMPKRFDLAHRQHRKGFFKKPKVRRMGEEGMELFGRKKDGTEFPVEISLSPLQTDEGLLVSAAIRDITERKKAEAEIRQYNLELESKNRELEQFAYVASHDLQEPLSTVSSFVELLDKQYKDLLDEKGTTYLRFVKESSDRMRGLVTALLAYSRLGRDRKLEKVDCNQLVNNVISDLDASIKGREAEIKVDKLPVLMAYPTELKILLQNLIGNAIKFVAPDKKPKVEVSARRTESAWEFSVKDNGIGIDEKFKEKIFVIFQRLHNISEYEGTGIGLAQCKKIVELHGGKIWVESTPGEGSCFNFKIPVQ